MRIISFVQICSHNKQHVMVNSQTLDKRLENVTLKLSWLIILSESSSFESSRYWGLPCGIQKLPASEFTGLSLLWVHWELWDHHCTLHVKTLKRAGLRDPLPSRQELTDHDSGNGGTELWDQFLRWENEE